MFDGLLQRLDVGREFFTLQEAWGRADGKSSDVQVARLRDVISTLQPPNAKYLVIKLSCTLETTR